MVLVQKCSLTAKAGSQRRSASAVWIIVPLREVYPPPLGGGFSVSFAGCGHEQLSQGLPQCFLNSPAPGLDNQVSEKDFVRRHRQKARALIRGTCEKHQVEILKGHMAPDHIHLFVSIPPNLAVSKLMQQLKGRPSHAMISEFPLLRRQYWGRHMWARGYFCCSSGNVTDDVIKQRYCATGRC